MRLDQFFEGVSLSAASFASVEKRLNTQLDEQYAKLQSHISVEALTSSSSSSKKSSASKTSSSKNSIKWISEHSSPNALIERVSSLVDLSELNHALAVSAVTASSSLRPRAQQALNNLAVLSEARHYLDAISAVDARTHRLNALTETYGEIPPSESSTNPEVNFTARNINAEERRKRCEEVVLGSELVAQILALRESLPERSKARASLSHVNDSIEQWRLRVLAETKKAIADVGWPCVPGQHIRLENINELQHALTSLTVLQNALEHAEDADADSEWWALSLLLHPLLLRFDFHFCREGADTNRADKPEWFLVYIESTLAQHVPVLTRIVMSMRASMHICDNVERHFIQALLSRARVKLDIILPILAAREDNFQCFQHTIDEILRFDVIIRNTYTTPYELPSTASLTESLTQSKILAVWMALERATANQQLDHLVSSTTSSSSPWTPRAHHGQRITTVAADDVMSILARLSTRFSALPRLHHRLQFARLQQRVLDVFADRLEAVLETTLANVSAGGSGGAYVGRAQHSWSAFAGMLNTADAMLAQLQRWSDEIMFVELHHYQHCVVHDDVDDDEAADTTRKRHDWTSQTIVELESFGDIDGLFFDEQMQRYQSLVDEFLQLIIKVVLKSFYVSSTSYRRKGHLDIECARHTMTATHHQQNTDEPAQQEQQEEQQRKLRKQEEGETKICEYELPLSPDIVQALATLQTNIGVMESSLCMRLFTPFWTGSASGLDVALFDDIVRDRYFSIDGARQFARDIDALQAVFRAYTIAPSSFFPKITAALRLVLHPRNELLAMLRPSSPSSSSSSSSSSFAVGVRDTLQLFALTHDDVECICRRIVAVDEART